MSKIWTLSGSCPLCLTPPCYHLRAAGNGGSFLFLSQIGAGVAARQLCRQVFPVPAGLPQGGRAMLGASVSGEA